MSYHRKLIGYLGQITSQPSVMLEKTFCEAAKIHMMEYITLGRPQNTHHRHHHHVK